MSLSQRTTLIPFTKRENEILDDFIKVGCENNHLKSEVADLRQRNSRLQAVQQGMLAMAKMLARRPARQQPKEGGQAFQAFRNYRPTFSTAAGLVTGHLHKVEYSKRNGEPVAYYRVRYFDRNLRTNVSGLYLFAMRNGVPTEIKVLSVRQS
jgi:hypothetical protein